MKTNVEQHMKGTLEQKEILFEVKLQNSLRLINGSYGSQSDFNIISEAERNWEKEKLNTLIKQYLQYVWLHSSRIFVH